MTDLRLVIVYPSGSRLVTKAEKDFTKDFLLARAKEYKERNNKLKLFLVEGKDQTELFPTRIREQ